MPGTVAPGAAAAKRAARKADDNRKADDAARRSEAIGRKPEDAPGSDKNLPAETATAKQQ
jgi:hypothetical protein